MTKNTQIGLTMFRSIVPTLKTRYVSSSYSNLFIRTLSGTSQVTSTSKQTPDLTQLKLDSIGSSSLYAIFKLHNIPYLVTKGDKVVLPFKLKEAEVGDLLILNDVVTLGSPEFTYNDDKAIPKELFDLKANVVEITREPYYEVYRKKQRCRRLKTFPVQNYQTILMINELKLK